MALDDDRNLWLLDRAKDVIVTGGENVYSIEVEEVLARHPAVVESAVFGIPDEQSVEAVHAVVVVASPGEVSGELAEELREHCRTTIAGFKVPERIELQTDPLPKSGPGKIQKRQLHDPYWEPPADPAVLDSAPHCSPLDPTARSMVIQAPSGRGHAEEAVADRGLLTGLRSPIIRASTWWTRRRRPRAAAGPSRSAGSGRIDRALDRSAGRRGHGARA